MSTLDLCDWLCTTVSKCACLEQATLFVFFNNKAVLSIINVFIFRVDVWRAAHMAALNDRGANRSLILSTSSDR
jgi:hypothetical protein